MKMFRLFLAALLAVSSAAGQDNSTEGEKILVRLAAGDNPTNGRVEIYYKGEWGTICDDNWNIEGANVICRMLGYDGALEYIHSGKFGPGEGSILMDNVDCKGTEKNISECKFNGWGVHDCSHHEDAGLKCNKRRLPGFELLDRGPQNEFEVIRLKAPRGIKRKIPQFQGYLEVAYRKKWHRVCVPNWQHDAATVVCGQLGFPGALKVNGKVSSKKENRRKSRYLMASLNCTGAENEIKYCSHNINASAKRRDCKAGEPMFITCIHHSRKKWKKHVKKRDIRLKSGARAGEGRLEIKVSHLWGTVCHHGFNIEAANVACRQLGYGTAKRALIDSFYGQGQGVIWMTSLNCHGSETRLNECEHELVSDQDFEAERGCTHYEEAGVACHVPQVQHNRRIRLVGGRNPMEGRVEIKVKKKWGPICSDQWTIREAMVACKQLGLGFALHAIKDVYFFLGTPNITQPVMAGVDCKGNEDAIQHCSHVTGSICNTASRSMSPFAGAICTEMSPDLVLDVPLLQQSTHLDQQPFQNLLCAAEEKCLASSAYKPEARYESRRLLRFSSRVWNRGRSDFRPKRTQSEWIWHQCHGHYHSMAEFTHYDILDQNLTKVAEGHKASFCLEDSECDPDVNKRFDCDQPGGGTQGIAVGCADNYQYNIDCQWIDITDVPSGNYIFRVRVNPHALVAESDFDNNEATCNLRYDGYRVWVWGCYSADNFDRSRN